LKIPFLKKVVHNLFAMDFWTALFTGLTTGGITCVAVQGGLLASVLANQKKHLDGVIPESQKRTSSLLKIHQQDWLPITSFLISKLVVHTLLGFVLGSLGSLFSTNITLQLTFQALAGLFMLATVANLLELHPIFRYVVFQPPRFIQRLIRQQTKSELIFAPVILGIFTVFIPCGVTQAMEFAALGSGSGVLGAAIMAGFTLGTIPMFGFIGVLTQTLTGIWQKRFTIVTAIIVFLLAVNTLNGVAIALDSPVTLQKVTEQVEPFVTPPQLYKRRLGERQLQQSLAKVENGVQKVKIDITDNGYTPKTILVRQNVPVELDLETQGTYSCASHFVLKAFDIQARLEPTERRTVAFTPKELGEYSFSCSMGMYDGKIIVVKG
jgi:uncharacterized protein